MRTCKIVVACAAFVVGLAALAAAGGDAAVPLAAQGKQPRVAVSDKGLVAVVYGQGNEIFSRTSNDGGLSYGEATRVGEVEKLMLGMRRGPQVAAAGSSLVITAIGRVGNLVSWRSADGGLSWKGPATVNDSPTSAREGLHGLAAGADAFHAVWLDLRDQRTKVFRARSSDGGQSWEENRVVYESPDGTVCECCQPTVAADDRGGVAVMWRNSLGGARDMFLARSSDGARTFGAAQKLGTGTWPLKGCPMDGGGVTVSGNRFATIWRREDGVYAAAGSEEEPLGPGRNGVVAFGARGVVMAWQTADGDVILKDSTSPAGPVARGRFPHLGAAPSGRGPVVLAWEDPEQGVMARAVAAPEQTRGR